MSLDAHGSPYHALPPAVAQALSVPAEPLLDDADDDVTPPGDGATVADVLDWVGDDADRAAAALGEEQGRDVPRTTLVTALEKVVAAADDDDDEFDADNGDVQPDGSVLARDESVEAVGTDAGTFTLDTSNPFTTGPAAPVKAKRTGK